MPYKKSDLIFFESSNGTLDSIQVFNRKLNIRLGDPLDMFSPRHKVFESYFMIPYVKKIKKHITIFTVYGGKNGNSGLSFKPISFYDKNEYCSSSDFDKANVIQMFRERKIYKFNSIKIDLENHSCIKSFWWSKKYGYTKFEYVNGQIWELKKFIRNEKDILLLE